MTLGWKVLIPVTLLWIFIEMIAIYFNLQQGSNPNKQPEIFQIVVKEIEKYQKKYNFKPIFFTSDNKHFSLIPSILLMIFGRVGLDHNKCLPIN